MLTKPGTSLKLLLLEIRPDVQHQSSKKVDMGMVCRASYLFSRVCDLADRFWCTLQHLECLTGYNDVIRVVSSGNLTAVGTVAECLCSVSRLTHKSEYRDEHTTIAGSPEYSTLIFSQKQLPVGMLTAWWLLRLVLL